MMDILPTGHGERDSKLRHYYVVDLDGFPNGCTSMSVFWKVPFVKRIKLLLTGNLETSFLTSSVPSLRVDV